VDIETTDGAGEIKTGRFEYTIGKGTAIGGGVSATRISTVSVVLAAIGLEETVGIGGATGRAFINVVSLLDTMGAT
jgi:hypothetical protein